MKWPVGMTYVVDSEGEEREAGTAMSEMTLRYIEWIGACKRRVSRMTESSSLTSFRLSYSKGRKVPSGLPKSFFCSSYKASLSG